MDQHIDSAAGAHSKMLQGQLSNVLDAMNKLQESNRKLEDNLERERKETATTIQQLQDKLKRERNEAAVSHQRLKRSHDRLDTRLGVNASRLTSKVRQLEQDAQSKDSRISALETKTSLSLAYSMSSFMNMNS